MSCAAMWWLAKLTVDDLVDGFEAETLDGNPLTFTVDGDTVLVNDAAITRPTMALSMASSTPSPAS